MLVTLKEILDLAEAGNFAVGAFNTPNLECVRAVIGGAEELNVPVIIQHAQVHEGLTPLSVMGPIMLDFAKKATVPVCVHLDHGSDLIYVEQALKIGFTSVMYDGSVLSYEENVANTKIAVNMAKKAGASVEAELGCMGKTESGAGEHTGAEDDTKIYTNPDEAKLFVEETGINALACSFGTTHGIYISEPKLDFSVVENVRQKAHIPVVMHGGSGVCEEDVRTAIKNGVRKINYFTYMDKEGGAAVKKKIQKMDENATVFYHDIINWGIQAMKENAMTAMKVFSMK